MQVPKELDRVNVRYSDNGTFFIVRPNKLVEDYFDSKYHRIPRSLRWHMAIEDGLQIMDLRDQFKDGCYIIGKGISIDKLTRSIFENSSLPIVCINQSIHHIEEMDLPNPIFMIQTEGSLKDQAKPKKAAVLVSYVAHHYFTDYDNTYIFNSGMLGLGAPNPYAVINALAMAKMFDAKIVHMISFDCYTHDDIDYSKRYPRISSPNTLRVQKGMIDKAIEGMHINWITPGAPLVTSDDTPEPLPRSLPEHRETSPEESSVLNTDTED